MAASSDMRLLSLFHQYILRDLFRNPVRTGLTVTGVALGIAVVVAVHLANARAVESFNDSLLLLGGRADLQITANGLPLDETLISRLAWVWEIGSMSPIVQGGAVLERSQGRPSEEQSLQIVGMDLLSDHLFRSYTLRDNRDLSLDVTRDEFIDLLLDPTKIVVPAALAGRLGLVPGSSLPLLVGDARRDFIVGAVLRDSGAARAFDGNLVFMDIAGAQLALDRIGSLDRIDVRVNARDQIAGVEARIRTELPATAVVYRPDAVSSQNEKMLRAFRYNLTALSYIALIVGVILIYNTLAVAVVRRELEIGMLRTLGAGRGTIALLFLGEAILLGFAGSIAGIVLGELLAGAAGAAVGRTIASLYTGVTTAASHDRAHLGFQAGMVAFGVALAALSGAGPALRATQISPVSVMREGVALGGTIGRQRRGTLAGAGLLAAGLGLSLGPPLQGFPFLGYGAALCFVAALALLTPFLVRHLIRLLRRPLCVLSPAEGRLAIQSMESGRGRIAVAVLSLGIAVAMLVSVATMVASFRDTVVVWVNQTLRADLYIRAAAAGSNDWSNPFGTGTVEGLARVPGVAAIDRFRGMTLRYEDSPVTLGAGEFGILADHGEILFLDGRSAAQVAPRMIGRDRVIVSEPFALKHGVRRGDRLELAAAMGKMRFEVEAVFYDYSSDRGLIVMDRTTFVDRFRDASVTNVAVYLQPGADPERVRSEIARRLPGVRLRIFSNGQLRRQVLRVFDQTFAITYALEVIALVVAVLGVANTLAALILERRPEIAVLRFIGAGRRQIRKIVVLESGLVGFLGNALGLLLGLLLSLLLIYVINKQSFGWTIQFAVPGGFLLGSLALVFLATLVAGLYPALLAVRMDPIQCVRAE
ncbi:MAG: ABC transporter permease [Acidobacteria bacterium]|nr:ABC transporter permease [Acidobacteriota bacterium]